MGGREAAVVELHRDQRGSHAGALGPGFGRSVDHVVGSFDGELNQRQLLDAVGRLVRPLEVDVLGIQTGAVDVGAVLAGRRAGYLFHFVRIAHADLVSNGCYVQLFQHTEEVAGELGGYPQLLHSVSYPAQQPRKNFGQMDSVLIQGLWRNAPDKVVHGLDSALPAVSRITFLEVADEQELFPVSDEKFPNDIVHPGLFQATRGQLFRVLSGKRQAFTILDDIGNGARGVFGPVFRLFDE